MPVETETPAGEVPATGAGRARRRKAKPPPAHAAKGDAKGGAKPEAKGGKAEGKKKE